MKTIEELNTMTPTQLKGIAQGLGVSVPDLDYRKGENKAKLIQLVYDIQQPDAPNEDPADKPEEKSKEITTAEQLDAKLQEIADFYEGDIEPTGDENPAGESIFAVTDVAGDEVARGTFAELYAHITKEQAEENAGDAAALGDVPLDDEATRPKSTETPPVQDEDELAQIEKGLKALHPLGLRYEIEGSTVKLSRGSQIVTTTLNQPAHRVVRTAESMCNLS